MERRGFIKMSACGSAVMMTNPFRWFSTQNETVDNLIIGSGYGSAVTALRLTQAGHTATMLEMGLDWDNNPKAIKPFSNMLLPGKNSTWLSNQSKAPFLNIYFFEKYTGILDRWDFDNVKVYMGRGVGGGSLVNGGMSVTPKREYFEQILPHLDSEDFYQKYFPLANQTLEINVIPDEYYKRSDYYKFSRVGTTEAVKAGYKTVKVPNVYDFGYMQQEEYDGAPKSALAQEVIYGNNYGKKSLDKTYIKHAKETGLLNILDLHKVETITENTDGTFSVAVAIIDTKGETVAQKTITAKRLFLGAGSLGSTKLLLKAKAQGTLKKLDNTIGQGWGNNGNIMAGRLLVNTLLSPVDTGEGDIIGTGTGLKQSTIPVDGIDNWDDPEKPYFVEIAPFPTGAETFASLYLLINKLPKLGELKYVPSNDYEIEPTWGEEHYGHTVEHADHFLEKMNATNGGTKTAIFPQGRAADICYHPLGGLVNGTSTNAYGRVNNYSNLYVMDGAQIPGTIGVNPYVTITAVAEHNIENIIKKDMGGATGITIGAKRQLSIAPSFVLRGRAITLKGIAMNELILMNEQGQTIETVKNLNGSKTHHIQTENLSSGNYFIVVNGKHHQRFIIQ